MCNSWKWRESILKIWNVAPQLKAQLFTTSLKSKVTLQSCSEIIWPVVDSSLAWFQIWDYKLALTVQSISRSLGCFDSASLPQLCYDFWTLNDSLLFLKALFWDFFFLVFLLITCSYPLKVKTFVFMSTITLYFNFDEIVWKLQNEFLILDKWFFDNYFLVLKSFYEAWKTYHVIQFLK